MTPGPSVGQHQKRSAMSPPTCNIEGLALRPAVFSDSLCLSVLATQVFLDTYATEGIRPGIAREVLSGFSARTLARAVADPSAAVCVAERARHLVGYAHVTFGGTHGLAPDGQQAELLRLYVQEPFTGKHLGSILLAEAERLARERGTTVLWLTPWVHNHRALAFYARRGYEDYGLTHFVFDGESHENRLYAKRLGTPSVASREHSW